MNASEARIALESVVKPLRALLDVQQILDAAVALDAEARDHEADIAARRSALGDVKDAVAVATAELAAVRASAREAVSEAEKLASNTLAQAKADAAGILATAKFAVQANDTKIAYALRQADAKVDECEAAATAALTAKHNAEIALADLSKSVAAEQAQLAAIRDAIAKARGV